MRAPELELKDVGALSSAGYQRWIFAFETISIMVQHAGTRAPEDEEVGVRLEIQRLGEQPGSTESDAIEMRLYDPIFRADLFALSSGAPGNIDAAHYHPCFDGRDPGDRVFDAALTEDPIGWLTLALSDLDSVLETARRPELAHRADTSRVAAAVPSIVEAVRMFLASVPSSPR